VIPIDTSLLRLTWLVIEETQSSNVLSLTDTGLVRLLLQRISDRILLSGEEVYLLYDYISSKTTLIRDMAESRFVYHTSVRSKLEEHSPAALPFEVSRDVVSTF